MNTIFIFADVSAHEQDLALKPIRQRLPGASQSKTEQVQENAGRLG